MKILEKVVIAVLVVVVAFLAIARFSDTKNVSNSPLGANPTGDFYTPVTFFEGMTIGGGIIATSTASAVVPLLARDIEKASVIDVTLNLQDATLSFPASTTLSAILRNVGDTRTIYVRNATTTQTMDITITGGTGVLLKKATSSAVLFGDTDGGNYAKINLTRKSNQDIEALLSIFMD